jgi:hypothetical protein
MSNLQNLWNTAVKKFGLDNVAAMANVCGSTNGTWEKMPAARLPELENVLGRMLRNGVAVARASADFGIFEETNAALKGNAGNADDDDDDADDADLKNAAGFPMASEPAPREHATSAAALDPQAIYSKWNRPNGRKLGDTN